MNGSDRYHAAEQLTRAIARTQAAIDALEATLDPDTCPCCVGAALGGTYSQHARLERKLERQEAWLEVLRVKITPDGIAPHVMLGDKRCHARVPAYERYTALVHTHRGLDPESSRATTRAEIVEWAPPVHTIESWWSAWCATFGRIGSEHTVAHWRQVFGPPGTARGW